MNLFNINPNYNFLESLSRWIVEKFRDDDRGVMVVLPTKRSCMEFESLFVSLFSGREVPRIVAISELSVDDLIFVNKDIEIDRNTFYKQSDKGDFDYIVDLSKDLRNTKFFGNMGIAQSLNMASSIKSLFDEIIKSDISFDEIAFDDYNVSSHQQFTLDFLKTFYMNFKYKMSKAGIKSSVEIQKNNIEGFTRMVKNQGLRNIVIFAGSTGSVNYVKGFIKAVCTNSSGYFVANGFCYNGGGLNSKDPGFLIHDLLSFLGAKYRDVVNINYSDLMLAGDCRYLLLSQSLNEESSLCVQKNQDFLKIKRVIKDDFDSNVNIATFDNEMQEARSISNYLLSRVTQDQRVGVVCPNSRSMSLMKSFLDTGNARFNDNERLSLNNLVPIKLFLDIAKSIDLDMNSVSILCLLKNQLIVDNKTASCMLDFEQEFIRSYRSSSDILATISLLESLDHDRFDFVTNILQRVYGVYKKRKFADVYEIFTDIKTVVEFIAGRKFEEIFKDDYVEKVTSLIEDIRSYQGIGFEKDEIYDFFNRIFSFTTFSVGFDRNLNIELTTPIESRLINYDLLIFVGLDRSSYPTFEKESWISGKIKRDLGIFNGDKKISLAGYDFCNLLSNSKVILSFSGSVEGVKVAPSYFLDKISSSLAFCDIEIKNLDLQEEVDGEVFRKNLGVTLSPKINLNKHLKSISSSDLVTINKSPYSFYAKKVLKLGLQKDIDCKPGNAEFGSFIHKMIECAAIKKSALSQNEIDKLFNSYYKCKESKLLWLPRAKNILDNFVNDNTFYLEGNDLHEAFFSKDFCGFSLKAKIDRIHLNKDGEMQIFDYKTGTPSSKKDVKSWRDPQLLIYAILSSNSDNPLLADHDIGSIFYWKLNSGKDNEIKKMMAGEELLLEVNQCEQSLLDLMDYFSNDSVEFLARSQDKYQDEYMHIARINNYL